MRWVAAMVLAACWRDAPPPKAPIEEPPPPQQQAMLYRHPPPVPRDKFDEVLERMRGYTDQMCQCSDSNCTGQVTGELTKWMQEVSKDPELQDPLATRSEEQMKQMSDVTKQLTDCMMRAMAPTSAPPSP